MKYVGSFRIYHEEMKYSDGVFCYSPDGTLFMSKGFMLGEFMPPEPVHVIGQDDAPLATIVQEPFDIRSKLPDNFPITRFRITGMVFSDGKLVVNYTDWYAAGGKQYYTTMVIHDPHDLTNCTVDWEYSMEGIARKSGCMYSIPEQHQELFGGAIASFAPKESIIGRHDLGPSCLAFSLSDLTQTEFSGNILMDYPFYDKNEDGTPRLFYDKAQYSAAATQVQSFSDKFINNIDMPNELAEHTYNTYWTAESRVVTAFIKDGRLIVITPLSGGTRKPYYNAEVPGDVSQGLGYKGKIEKWIYDHDVGKYIANAGDKGYGPAIADDTYTSVLTFELSDLHKVRKGELSAHEVRPVSQSLHKQPVAETLRDGIHAVPRHGAYHNDLLTLSYEDEALIGSYGQVPLFNVFEFESVADAKPGAARTITVEVDESTYHALSGKKLKLSVE